MADHAIIIGIDNYPGISNLSGPCNDAVLFQDWLTKPTGGGVDPANVSLMLSSQFAVPTSVNDAHPVQSEIDALFRPHVQNAFQDVHSDGRLFIYVAGHGFADPQDMASAALYSADASVMFYTNVAIHKYAQFFRLRWAFDEILLIFDACRTTIPFQRISSPPLPEIPAHANASRVKLFQAYATGFDKAAREKDFDGTTHGIFTKAVLDALESATPNHLGRVTGTVIKRHVHNAINRFAGDVTVPPPDIVVDEDRDVLFLERHALAATGIETRFTTQDHHIGQTLVIESGNGNEVTRATVEASLTTLRLEPGIYRVRVLETDQSTLFEVPGHAIVAL